MFYYLDNFPPEDRKIFVHDTDESGGGPAANAAYLLSTWGIKTAFAGCLGDDREAQALLDEFDRVGTDISLVKKNKDFRTPFSSIIVNRAKGTRTILTRHMDPPAYSPDLDLLYRGNAAPPKIILADGHQLMATLEAKDRFRDSLLVLDAGSLRDATRTLLLKSDYAVCSEVFGAAFIDQTSLDTMDKARKATLAIQTQCKGQVAITLGKRGVIFVENNKMRSLPAFPVNAVDTTAAGDIFHGAFVFALHEKMSFYDALIFASAAAAISVTRPGGRASIPNLAEVREFLCAKHNMLHFP